MKLYYLNTERLDDSAVSTLESVVQEHRLLRIARTKCKKTKKELICTDALLKYAVSKECGVLPRRVENGYKESGAPYILGMPVNISISHSCGRILVGISKHKIGVDIELIRSIDHERISDRYFTEGEKELIAYSPDKIHAFLSVWTAKEAYFKASNESYDGLLAVDTSNERAHVTVEYDGCIASAVGENEYEFFEITENDIVSYVLQ